MSLGMHVSTHPSHGANPNPDLKLNRVGGWVATSPETMSSSSLSRLSMLFFHWAACAGNLGRKKMRGCGVLHCKKKKNFHQGFVLLHFRCSICGCIYCIFLPPLLSQLSSVDTLVKQKKTFMALWKFSSLNLLQIVLIGLKVSGFTLWCKVLTPSR